MENGKSNNTDINWYNTKTTTKVVRQHQNKAISYDKEGQREIWLEKNGNKENAIQQKCSNQAHKAEIESMHQLWRYLSCLLRNEKRDCEAQNLSCYFDSTLIEKHLYPQKFIKLIKLTFLRIRIRNNTSVIS